MRARRRTRCRIAARLRSESHARPANLCARMRGLSRQRRRGRPDRSIPKKRRRSPDLWFYQIGGRRSRPSHAEALSGAPDQKRRSKRFGIRGFAVMTLAIHRFTRDLRLSDHAGLAAAAAHGEVLPVLILDRALEHRMTASPRRAQAYCTAVAALDHSLRERGSRLIVRRGIASTVIKQLARASGAQAVGWSAAFDRAGMEADQRLQSAVEEAGLRAIVVHDTPAIPPEETTAARPSAGDGYRSFVPYHDLWRTLEPASYELPLLLRFAGNELESEKLPQPADFGSTAGYADAGERQSLRKLETFLSGDGLQYAFALNLPADDRTAHLGPDLTFGTISARTIVRETRKRIDDPFLLAEERGSLKLFYARSLCEISFCSSRGIIPRPKRLRCRRRCASFVSPHRTRHSTHGARAAPDIRWSMPEFVSCTRRVGCTLECARLPLHSYASIWESIGAPASRSGTAI